MTDRLKRLRQACLYLVCGTHDDAFVAAALRGGVDIVQLRLKDAPDEAIVRAGERYRRLCDQAGALLIVNDRPDLARACGADGVHVGQDDDSVRDARRAVGAGGLVGLSTHTPEQIDAADGVDYIGVGPVHATPTKPGRPAVGLQLVRYAAVHAAFPWFAIGGINAACVGAVIDAGARRVAVVRAITQAGDPQAAAAALRAAVTDGVSVGAT